MQHFVNLHWFPISHKSFFHNSQGHHDLTAQLCDLVSCQSPAHCTNSTRRTSAISWNTGKHSAQGPCAYYPSSTCIHKFCSFFKHVSAQMWPSLRCTQTALSTQYEIAQILHQHYSSHCLPLTLGFFHNMYYTTLYLLIYLWFLWLSYWNIDSMREKEKTGFLFFTVASPEQKSAWHIALIQFEKWWVNELTDIYWCSLY